MTATATHLPHEGRRPPTTWTWLAHPNDPTPPRHPRWDGHATRLSTPELTLPVPPWQRGAIR